MVGEGAIGFGKKGSYSATFIFKNFLGKETGGAVAGINGHLKVFGDFNIFLKIINIGGGDFFFFLACLPGGKFFLKKNFLYFCQIFFKNWFLIKTCLEAVIFRRVMAGGNHNGGWRLKMVPGKINHRGNNDA